MSGTRSGVKKAVVTNKLRHGADHYEKIGFMGGKKSRGGGFTNNKELARIAGSKGGKISRRPRSVEKVLESVQE